MARPLERFVREQLGPVEIIARPPVRGSTRLLHVRDSVGGEWFAKRLTTSSQWRAESSAYEVWREVRGVPLVAASCHRRQSLLLPRIVGTEVDGRSRPDRRAAGRILRRLHDVAPPPTWTSGWREILVTTAGRRLEHLARHGIRVDQGLVRDHVEELVAWTGPEVATHGDFLPRNWILARDHQLHVLDFGAAGLRPAVSDFCKLRYHRNWRRPGAFADIVAGYGRPLTAEERRFLEAMLPWRAVVAMSLGVNHRWHEVVRHGLDVLEGVGRGVPWGVDLRPAPSHATT